MAEASEPHVAVFVFPFGSHPVPLFNLVLKISRANPNISFSFIGTEASNKPLLSRHNTPPSITFHTIGDGVPEGHVPGTHPVERVNLFLQAGAPNLQKGIDSAQRESKRRVTCVIADAFVTASLTVAERLKVPWVPVWPPLSCSLSAHFHTDLIREKCGPHSDPRRPLDFLPGLSKIRVEDLPDDVTNGGDDESFFSKSLASLGKLLPHAKAVVVNFFEEIDPPLYVEDMRSKLNSLLYVGFLTLDLPLPPLPPSDTDATGCLSWLDGKPPSSVAYVSFGTVVTPPPHEIAAVAEALEEAGFPFLWSLKEHAKGSLPEGFMERTGTRGKVVAWAPQSHVLGHGSVGVFVTHCGCNSVFESISNGVPMICRPFFGDQGMTGRMVEDLWEIGVKVEGGGFSRDGLVKNLNLVLVGEQGRKMKEKAMKLKETVLDAAGPNGRAVQDFKALLQIVSST